MSEYVFKLPDLGEGTVEAEIAEWMVKVGDKVNEEDPICAMLTDKAAVELTAPVTGTVSSVAGEGGLAESSVEYGCTCGPERAIGAVAALGEAELRDMLDKDEIVPVKCDYCTQTYEVSPDDVRRILEPDPPEQP